MKHLTRKFWQLRSRRGSKSRLRVHALESRTNPATITVTNTANSGAGSLRNAVDAANFLPSADTIIFDPTVFNAAKIITLTTGEISIDGALTITGPGANLLSISGNASSRAFNTTATLSTEPISFSGLTIASCVVSGDGGAILVADEAITFANCTLTNNIATSDGGAIYGSDSPTLSFTECNFINNQVQVNGGAIHLNDGGNLTFERCTLSANVAVTGNGGAVFAGGKVTSTVTVRNSTLSGNSANAGGAVALSSTKGSLIVRNSTLTLNDADTSAGGGIARTSGGMIINIESSIVSGNTNATAPDISSSGTVNVNFCAIGSNAGFTLTGANNLAFGTALKLAALADNGGPTKAHLPAVDSPVVDKGSNTIGFTTDQRGPGYPRILNGTADIGSFETKNFVVRNSNDGGTGSLRQTIIEANAAIGPDSITFDSGAFALAKTITLLSGQLSVTESLTITGPSSAMVAIDGNHASRVFSVTGTDLTVTGIAITGGQATDGGGVLVSGGVNAHLVLDSCIVSGNTASGYGGGVSFDGNNLLIRNSSINGNKALAGGGVKAQAARLEISKCSISLNSAVDAGGGLVLTTYTLSLGDALLIRDTTLSGNSCAATSANGGGIWLQNNRSMTILNVTIVNNSAAHDGGGIYSIGDLFYLTNSIVANNSAASGPDINRTMGFPINVEYCAIGNPAGFTLSGSNNLPFGIDLKLGALANNGGPTSTHMPASDSPLRDFGTMTAYSTDQRGVGYPRSMGLATDIGAVEFKDLAVHNVNDKGPGSLRQVIADANVAVGADTVTFDPLVFSTPQTITLVSGEILISDEITVTGPGRSLLSVSGNLASRIFRFDLPVQYTRYYSISDLTLTQGRSVGAGGSAILIADELYAHEVLTLQRVDVANNYVFNTALDDGGALRILGYADINIIDCSFTANGNGPGVDTSQSSGGAININYGSLSLLRSSIANNSSNLNGGGIYVDGSAALTVIDCAIASNTAAESGGGIFDYSTKGLTLSRSLIANNKANGEFASGGGLILLNIPASIQNTTISGNQAFRGGGLRVSGGGSNVVVRNTTIALNTALYKGPGISVDTGTVSCESTIVCNNGGLSQNYDGAVSLQKCLVDVDAQLGPLGNNGGLTQTHALLPGSPCIDAGSNPAMSTTDQRGAPFLREYPSGKTDIGAYEFQFGAKVLSVQVNDNSPQRSRVTSLTITFDSALTLPTNKADAFQMKRQSDSAVVGLSASVASNAVTLTFASGPLDYGSLADGRYTVTVLASQVNGGLFDGNGDGAIGDNYLLIGSPVNGLFRLFGDADGNGLVDGLDFGAFRTAFNTNSSIFDFDNSGIVDGLEFGQFRLRFGMVI